MHLNVLSNVKSKWLVCYGLRMCLMLQTVKQFTRMKTLEQPIGPSM
jgi:hypothetical protein